ncbi:hypothetical protein BC835DRAFT_706030 [Cytidiella melzeri]|nr:hypothetical protein BC835DRAFT_706030 [Cytidiella melzeri]
MTQYPPLKHPIATTSPTPASSQTGLVTSPANFIPRKEFIKDHRTTSSFALLALSGPNLVRLYSFTGTVISGLRRLLHQKELFAGEREHTPKHFFEFTLEGKPWTNTKSITSEKLIVDILTVVLHSGYAFLSTIDYGRESDDRLAITFSKPHLLPIAYGPAAFPAMNGSTTSLNTPPRTPFAISFTSATLLRVVGPPLHSTPAILTAVRGAWPRGIVSDKKVGDATYEFKLKGYKWFQEDTFPMDSLNHILGLLSSLDGHGFTLLTSLSFNKPSRVKDFWVFTGISDDHSPPSTPTTLTHELKRDMTPLAHSIAPGPSPLSAGAEKKRSSPRVVSPIAANNATTPAKHNGHARSASDNTTMASSVQKPASTPFGSAPTALLRKPSPRTKLPAMLSSSKLNRSSSSGPRLSRAGTPTADSSTGPSAFGPQQMVRSLSNPSSVGSVDMTGVGRRSVSLSRTPDVFYVADGRGKGAPRQEYNPFHASFKPNAQAPHAAFIKVTTPTADRRASLDSKNSYPVENRPPLRPSIRRSSTIPITLDTRQDSSTSASRMQPPPLVTGKTSAGSDRALDPKENEPSRLKRETRDPPEALRLNEPRRTPTPPLLTPGTFRDSAFSWATGKTQDVPIMWTGREPDPSQTVERPVHSAGDTSGDRSIRALLHSGANVHPELDRNNSGPLPPGGWVPSSTPREDKGDVSQGSHKMFPPTIREQPSQEEDDRYHHKHHMSQSAKHLFMRGREPGRDAAYKSTEKASERQTEELAMGVMGHTGKTGGTGGTSGLEPVSGIAVPKPKPGRRETAMSGWVMVNVEGSANSQTSSRAGKSSSQSPPGSRPNVRHRRSNSDSGLLRPHVSNSPVGNAPAEATMSAAAKTIAMIDAVDAKNQEQEKSSTPSGLKRIFHRTKGSESDGGGKGTALRRKATPDEGVSKGMGLERDESDEKSTLKDKWKTRTGTPAAAKPGAARLSIE